MDGKTALAIVTSVGALFGAATSGAMWLIWESERRVLDQLHKSERKLWEQQRFTRQTVVDLMMGRCGNAREDSKTTAFHGDVLHEIGPCQGEGEVPADEGR